jgi:hypothetical protein
MPAHQRAFFLTSLSIHPSFRRISLLEIQKKMNKSARYVETAQPLRIRIGAILDLKKILQN